MDKQGCKHDWYMSWRKGQKFHSARCIICPAHKYVDLRKDASYQSGNILLSIEALPAYG